MVRRRSGACKPPPSALPEQTLIRLVPVVMGRLRAAPVALVTGGVEPDRAGLYTHNLSLHCPNLRIRGIIVVLLVSMRLTPYQRGPSLSRRRHLARFRAGGVEIMNRYRPASFSLMPAPMGGPVVCNLSSQLAARNNNNNNNNNCFNRSMATGRDNGTETRAGSILGGTCSPIRLNSSSGEWPA